MAESIPEKYKNLRYRTSNETILEFIHYGLALVLVKGLVTSTESELITKELARIEQLQEVRKDYKRVRAYNKRRKYANSINN